MNFHTATARPTKTRFCVVSNNYRDYEESNFHETIRKMKETCHRDPPRMALALGSSFHGYFAHAGFLIEMEKSGILPVAISGSSAGAIAGGLFAAGVRGDKLRKLVCSWRFLEAFLDLGMTPRLPLVALGVRNSGLLNGRRLIRMIERATSGVRIEQLNTPTFAAGVTHLETRKLVLLQSGELGKAVVASASIPGIFKPQKIGNSLFYDGGIADEAPIDHFLKDPNIDEIIIHRVLHRSAKKRSFFHYPYTACRHVVSERLLAYRLDQAKEAQKRIRVVETFHSRPNLLPFRQASEFLEAGQKTAIDL